jgi:hypothetical protein
MSSKVLYEDDEEQLLNKQIKAIKTSVKNFVIFFICSSPFLFDRNKKRP